MIDRKKALSTTMAAMSLLLLAGTASATTAEVSSNELDRAIQSCIAEVAQRANYDEASRVRHEVVKIEPALLGYALTIDTSVFAESDNVEVRQYTTHCVAYRDNKPWSFRIHQQRRGA